MKLWNFHIAFSLCLLVEGHRLEGVHQHALKPLKRDAELIAAWSLLQTRPHDGLSGKDSDGFMLEPDEQWSLRKERQEQQARMELEAMTLCRDDYYPGQKVCMPKCKEYSEKNCQANTFWQVHFEPSFRCLDERRIGNEGDGGKWICDPYKIKHQAEQGSGCLVYSIGSNGDFSFEKGVHESISDQCEIHTIDMHDWNHYTKTSPPPYVNYHVYTVGPEPNAPVSTIVKDLGHTGRKIDVFKIDCEGCEWNTYKSWFGEGVYIRQIQVELHGTDGNKGAFDFFNFLFDMGYVVFGKEPNTVGCGGKCIEYAFLKLSPEFSRPKSIHRKA
eukprot:TRINITY_DN28177_c1_g1_i1.p1 TRINITY_DN28177_c1_g1~~TRINITY_DN28177_c1_g1_i1.p1  ORF type:complete len:345 (+),score=45.07 TRINITY_DN28177_c1_g1_i1:51-1037(+)